MSALLSEGTLFGARYRIVRCIAAGGMGAVYEVIHTETNRRHALKVMHAHLFKSEEMRDRFKREARITADIESEFIVYISDAGIDASTRMPFMVMEFLSGEDLDQYVECRGRLPLNETLTYLRQVASALDRTHAANIVHRDLKPSNIFLTRRDDGSPRVKVLDFGVAKVIEDSTSAQGTQSIGTPMYMAPEQMQAGSKLTGAADIYALGLVTFTLLVGKPYWAKELQYAGGVLAFIGLAAQGPKVSATERAAEYGVVLPPAFHAWFSRISSPYPEARFLSANEALRELEQVFVGWTGVRVSNGAGSVPPTAHISTQTRVSRTGFPDVTVPVSSSTGSKSRPYGGETIRALSSTGNAPPDRSRIWIGVGVGIVAALSIVGVILGFLYSKQADSNNVFSVSSSSAFASGTSIMGISGGLPPRVEPAASALVPTPAPSSLAYGASISSANPKSEDIKPKKSLATSEKTTPLTDSKKKGSAAPSSTSGLFGTPLKL